MEALEQSVLESLASASLPSEADIQSQEENTVYKINLNSL